MKKRVLLAGLYHESHSFLEGLTCIEDFSILEQEEIYSCPESGSPMAGVIEFSRQAQWELLPIVDMRASPGPIVDDRIVELFWEKVRSKFEKEIKLENSCK